jgi:hypothetical protein
VADGKLVGGGLRRSSDCGGRFVGDWLRKQIGVQLELNAFNCVGLCGERMFRRSLRMLDLRSHSVFK